MFPKAWLGVNSLHQAIAQVSPKLLYWLSVLTVCCPSVQEAVEAGGLLARGRLRDKLTWSQMGADTYQAC